MSGLNQVGMAISSESVQHSKEFSSENSTLKKRENLGIRFSYENEQNALKFIF